MTCGPSSSSLGYVSAALSEMSRSHQGRRLSAPLYGRPNLMASRDCRGRLTGDLELTAIRLLPLVRSGQSQPIGLFHFCPHRGLMQ
jgi:hypothetical protein